MIKNIKDELYYNDLVYEIKKIANLDNHIDEEAEARIAKRVEVVKINKNGHTYETLSDFEIELFTFGIDLAEQVGENFVSLDEISKYPDIVKESLKKYENKISNHSKIY